MRFLAIVLVAIFLSMQVSAIDLGIKEDVSNMRVGDSVTLIFTLVGDDVERDVTFYVTSENSQIVSVAGLEWYRKNFHLNATEEVEIPVRLYGESEGVARVWYGFRGEEFEEQVIKIEVEAYEGNEKDDSIGSIEGDDGSRVEDLEVKKVAQDKVQKSEVNPGWIFILISVTFLIIAIFSSVILKRLV